MIENKRFRMVVMSGNDEVGEVLEKRGDYVLTYSPAVTIAGKGYPAEYNLVRLDKGVCVEVIACIHPGRQRKKALAEMLDRIKKLTH